MKFKGGHVLCTLVVTSVILAFYVLDIGTVLMSWKQRYFSTLPWTCDGTHCPSSHTKVILLTYMRSGSTFTGDILSAHPDVFYVFEPLHFVNKASRTNFTFLDHRTIYLNQEDKGPLLKQVISGFLSCNFDELDIGTLSDGMIMHLSKGTSDYVRCIERRREISDIRHCLPLLYNACIKKKVILIKTIRLPMTSAEQLMQKDPDVKVIYLIRDPRATIRSQTKLGMLSKYKDFETHVETVCKRILSDLIMFEKLKARYPKRVTLRLYENLADSPIEVSESLYKFLNLPFIPSIKDHVINITMSGVDKLKCGALCTHKANSSLQAQMWRSQLKFEKTQFIDTMCSEVYSYLGYRRATTEEEYLNISIPLHSNPRI